MMNNNWWLKNMRDNMESSLKHISESDEDYPYKVGYLLSTVRIALRQLDELEKHLAGEEAKSRKEV